MLVTAISIAIRVPHADCLRNHDRHHCHRFKVDEQVHEDEVHGHDLVLVVDHVHHLLVLLVWEGQA